MPKFVKQFTHCFFLNIVSNTSLISNVIAIFFLKRSKYVSISLIQ